MRPPEGISDEPRMAHMTIVSGGQTGVDRAAMLSNRMDA